MAFIATRPGPDGRPETLGVIRTVTDPDNCRAEFAIIVRSDMKGQGIGQTLMRKMIRYCRERGTKQMVGQILRENQPMRSLAERVGFRAHANAGEDAVEVALDLKAA
jgi:acetyltransferase